MGDHYIQSYKGFSRHLHSGRCCPIKRTSRSNRQYDRPRSEVVWVDKRYNPLDLRPNTPKPISPLSIQSTPLDLVPDEWVKPRLPSSREVSRSSAEKRELCSQPATRDESWSTLREMTPSIGRPFKHRPPSWGISGDVPPEMVPDPHTRFPRVNSSMSRHRVDEQFCYHNIPHIGLYAVKSFRGNAF